MRIDFSTDDALITALIGAARLRLENFCNRWFVERTADYALTRFPCGREFRLPGGRLKSVTSVKYYDTAEAEATFSADDYQVRTMDEPGSIVLSHGASWPSTTLRPAEGVITRFVAGYGNAAAVPQDIKNAVLLYVTHLYVHRGDADVPMPQAVAELLWPYRIVPCRKSES